jgi:glyoxylase-like metal-dependent hydrolase (beta-lactamase superfamily II)
METNILAAIMEKPMTTEQIPPDIMILEFPLVNAFLVGAPNAKSGEWILVGAGMAHTGKAILQAAESRFGKGSKPGAVILTHGHFDHVGAIVELINMWQMPVYAHKAELPFLTGKADYPPADPTVDDGLITKISPTFPNQGIDLGKSIQSLPDDGTIPLMPDWKWIHTPGHSPGHISLFRKSDRVLIVGDAFTTVKQSSAEAVLNKEKELNGPPAYFTIDWKAAENSVRTLKDLNPALAIPSHGLPMGGDELNTQLSSLVNNFNQAAVPRQGKYVQ